MRLVSPITVDDDVMGGSNVLENDYAVWTSGTFAVGDRRIVIATHSVYEAVTAGLLTVTPQDDPVNWVRVGSTNRWRAFDGSVGQNTSRSGTITYTLILPARCDSLVLIGMSAISLRVVCKDSGGTSLSDQTFTLLDTSGIVGWLDYFTYSSEYTPDKVVTGLPAPAGGSMEITLDAGGGTASIGEIGLGRSVMLGDTLSGTTDGFSSFSVRNVDAFGNITIVPRGEAKRTEFEFTFDTRSNRRIQRELSRVRDKPAFFYADEDLVDEMGLLVFGYADDFFPALSSDGTTFATLSVTGVS